VSEFYGDSHNLALIKIVKRTYFIWELCAMSTLQGGTTNTLTNTFTTNIN